MKNKQHRHRNNPVRLLTYAMYAQHPSVSRKVYLSHSLVRIRTAAIRRLLRIPSGRLADYLDWLSTRGYIDELETGHGYAQFKIRAPTDYNITEIN